MEFKTESNPTSDMELCKRKGKDWNEKFINRTGRIFENLRNIYA